MFAMFEFRDFFQCETDEHIFPPMQAHSLQQQNPTMIGYKRMRTKGIICRGNRPSDIDSNASAQDDDSEGKEVTEEGESHPKRRKTSGNEVFIHHSQGSMDFVCSF